MTSSLERIILARLPARPWKNGAGTTREIAASPDDGSLDDFDWRMSLADVTADGPFSSFDGIDRQIMLWRGAGLRLDVGTGRVHALDAPGVPFGFPGEAPTRATLIDGPTQALNVMTRRGRWHAECTTLRDAADVPSADACLILCGAGTWRLDDAVTLAPDEGVLWRDVSGPHWLVPLEAADGWIVVVRLDRHATR